MRRKVSGDARRIVAMALAAGWSVERIALALEIDRRTVGEVKRDGPPPEPGPPVPRGTAPTTGRVARAPGNGARPPGGS